MAETKPIKLLEISGKSWMGGIALQQYSPMGGIFLRATNFDPFEKLGIFKTSLQGTQQGASTLTTGGFFNVAVTISTHSYFYNFGDATKVYRVRIADGQTVDYSSKITDITTIEGAIQYKSKVIYASPTSVKANSLDLALANQVGLLSVTSGGVHVMHIGPDRNLYGTNINSVFKITSVSGTTGNSATYLTFEDDVQLRDLSDDGKHLVIAGDVNPDPSNNVLGDFRCFVAFWNMKSQDLSQYYEFKDNSIYFIERIEDEIFVHGRNNIYICSIDSPPQIIANFRGNAALASSFTTPQPGSVVSKNNNIIMWGGTGTTDIWAYGRYHPSMDKILFQPYSLTDTQYRSLFWDGTKLWVTTVNNKMYEFGTTNSRQASTMELVDIDFKQPHEFAFVKVVLVTPMTGSPESVRIQALTGDGDRIVFDDDGTGFDASGFGNITSHIFYPKSQGDSTDVAMFEDITNFIIINNRCEIRRIEFWGVPLEPDQNLMW